MRVSRIEVDARGECDKMLQDSFVVEYRNVNRCLQVKCQESLPGVLSVLLAVSAGVLTI